MLYSRLQTKVFSKILGTVALFLSLTGSGQDPEIWKRFRDLSFPFDEEEVRFLKDRLSKNEEFSSQKEALSAINNLATARTACPELIPPLLALLDLSSVNSLDILLAIQVSSLNYSFSEEELEKLIKHPPPTYFTSEEWASSVRAQVAAFPALTAKLKADFSDTQSWEENTAARSFVLFGPRTPESSDFLADAVSTCENPFLKAELIRNLGGFPRTENSDAAKLEGLASDSPLVREAAIHSVSRLLLLKNHPATQKLFSLIQENRKGSMGAAQAFARMRSGPFLSAQLTPIFLKAMDREQNLEKQITYAMTLLAVSKDSAAIKRAMEVYVKNIRVAARYGSFSSLRLGPSAGPLLPELTQIIDKTSGLSHDVEIKRALWVLLIEQEAFETDKAPFRERFSQLNEKSALEELQSIESAIDSAKKRFYSEKNEATRLSLHLVASFLIQEIGNSVAPLEKRVLAAKILGFYGKGAKPYLGELEALKQVNGCPEDLKIAINEASARISFPVPLIHQWNE
jgi:hypothetical protein